MDDSIQQWTRLESRCRGGTVKPLLLLPGPMVFTNNHTHTETHTLSLSLSLYSFFLSLSIYISILLYKGGHKHPQKQQLPVLLHGNARPVQASNSRFLLSLVLR